jgi:phytanoyl-CoA hydroxylase
MNKIAKADKKEMLSYKTSFDQHGFLVLPSFFDDDIINEALNAVELVKTARSMDVVADDLETGERSVLSLLPPDAVKRGRMKINDLYLQHPEIRALALDNRLAAILGNLLEHTPALCNSLYFEKGSAQGLHMDSFYMTPRTPLHLIAVWVALEDAHEDAGPLEYFPGSHLIEPMKFSTGSYHANEDEMPAWRTYVDAEITSTDLKKRSFAAKKGDVFIWHANLIHGGGAIKDHTLTRKSCVFHYFSEQDARHAGYVMEPQAGAFWMNRPRQVLPHDVAAKLPFAEETYLMRYPDVAAAVKSGMFSSGKVHYDVFGEREGRSPN